MLLPNILNEKGLFGRLALLQMDFLATLTSELSRLLDQADKQTHVATADTQALSQLALDRLAQALQVAMANGALLCSRGELRNRSKDNSSNQCVIRLFRVLLGRHPDACAQPLPHSRTPMTYEMLVY